MPQVRRARLELQFADGSAIDTWHSISMRDTFTDPLGAVDLETTPLRANVDRYRSLLAKGEIVSITINGIPQGRYLIQSVDRTYGTTGTVIRVQCHTPLVTPYEGDVDPDLSLQSQSDISVDQAILTVLRPYGFDRIVSDSRAHVRAISGKKITRDGISSSVKPLTYKDAIAHEGETAYQFLSRIYTRLGVALRMQFDGSLLIGAPDESRTPVATVVLSTKATANTWDRFIGTVTVHDTNAGQYASVGVRGQRAIVLGEASSARPNSTVVATDALPQRSRYRSTTAPFKPKYVKDKSSRDPEQARTVAHFELGMRAKEAYVVEGTVDGWVAQSGVLWTVDTCVRVVIEPEGLDEPMYLLERTLQETFETGQTTSLKLIPVGALILGQKPSS